MKNYPQYSWLNGAVVPWDQCVLHARTQAAFWGANVFEGIRAYWQEPEQQLSIFRLDEHINRLRRSMKCVGMTIEYSDTDIQAACVELLRANEFIKDVHIVIVAYFGMGLNGDPLGHTDDTGMHITALPMPRSELYNSGASVSISSWRRISDDTMPPRIKTGANYHNNRLAHQEAVKNGYNTALFMNQHGTLAESPGACLMIIREGKLYTPPGTSGVLEGITLASIGEIAEKKLGLTVEKREIDRTELYLADEAFLCGTLAEIQPIIAVDRIPIGTGAPGTLTRKLQSLYENAVRLEPSKQWSTRVYPYTPRSEA